MNKLRMSAYYYTFDETGVREIDEILSAVAHAGKAFHHTSEWTDEVDSRYYADLPHLEGNCCLDWIQNAANRAAKKSPDK